MVEVDEDEQDEMRGMSCKAFRQNAEDVFLQAFLILVSTYGQVGANQFCQMFLTKLDASSQNVVGVEACLFMLKSVEVAIQDDGIESSKDFVFKVFEKLLSDQQPFGYMFAQP